MNNSSKQTYVYKKMYFFFVRTSKIRPIIMYKIDNSKIAVFITLRFFKSGQINPSRKNDPTLENTWYMK